MNIRINLPEVVLEGTLVGGEGTPVGGEGTLVEEEGTLQEGAQFFRPCMKVVVETS